MLPNSSGQVNKQAIVKAIFGRIANTYDRMNKTISLGQDANWKRKAVDILGLENDGTYLDIGAGTGDLAFIIALLQPDALVIAAELTFPMVLVGKTSKPTDRISWLVADAHALPFSSNLFDGVISGYLIRNVVDPLIVLSEQYRVLNPGKKVVSLDTTPPEKNLLFPFVSIYLRILIPLLGRMIAQDKSAYTYLQESTRRHINAIELLSLYRQAGFINTQFIKLMAGTIAIHYGLKAENQG
jgi:demethylmenaquinone methyltransferase/2-methoxy-6-polyprenyl-1,4-benzoquinol methylase